MVDPHRPHANRAIVSNLQAPGRVVVATHGHCFDGLCSAFLFARLIRHMYPGAEPRFEYHGCGYGPGQNGVDPKLLSGDLNAILDFRFSTAPQLSWYFDHHVSAFPTPEDRAVFERGVGKGTMFHDGAYSSCTKLIADIGEKQFGLDPAPTAELVRWADMIDSASFPDAKMAVERKEPVLKLMTVIEHHGDDAFITRMVSRLETTPLTEVAASADVHEAYEPLGKSHETFVKLVEDHAKVVGHVVLVDLSGVLLDVAGKFVTYALYPESAYSVLLSRSKSKCKISIGYNPWSLIPRKHNVAAICERHGGGGHPVVGAISLPADKVEEARALAARITEELSG
jgi:hypothetical protein